MGLSHSEQSPLQEEINEFYSMDACVLGPCGIGKTNIFDMVTLGVKRPYYVPTIGFEPRCIKINRTNLRMWDTAGITNANSLLTSYEYLIKRCSIFIIVFNETTWSYVITIMNKIVESTTIRPLFIMVGDAPGVQGILERYPGSVQSHPDDVIRHLEIMVP